MRISFTQYLEEFASIPATVLSYVIELFSKRALLYFIAMEKNLLLWTE